jgi:molecular chaperone DnaJ
MDLYVILGVERGATLADVKRAYKRLARKFHPDINPGDRMAAAQFRQISEAYETLSDPDRRRRYDTTGTAADARGNATFGFEGFDFTISVQGHDAPTFGDLFADVFAQREARRGEDTAERGVDLHQTLTIAFDEAMAGGQRTTALTRQEHCLTCGGRGRLHADETRCLYCHGSGAVKSARGHMVFSKPCAYCGGSGAAADALSACHGEQVRCAPSRSPSTCRRAWPTRRASASRARAMSAATAANGDLYITVRVQPHALFERDGDDLRVTVAIAIHERRSARRSSAVHRRPGAAARAAGHPVGPALPHPRARRPSARDGRRGDLVVEVQLAAAVLDERSKELLREFDASTAPRCGGLTK